MEDEAGPLEDRPKGGDGLIEIFKDSSLSVVSPQYFRFGSSDRYVFYVGGKVSQQHAAKPFHQVTSVGYTKDGAVYDWSFGRKGEKSLLYSHKVSEKRPATATDTDKAKIGQLIPLCVDRAGDIALKRFRNPVIYESSSVFRFTNIDRSVGFLVINIFPGDTRRTEAEFSTFSKQRDEVTSGEKSGQVLSLESSIAESKPISSGSNAVFIDPKQIHARLLNELAILFETEKVWCTDTELRPPIFFQIGPGESHRRGLEYRQISQEHYTKFQTPVLTKNPEDKLQHTIQDDRWNFSNLLDVTQGYRIDIDMMKLAVTIDTVSETASDRIAYGDFFLHPDAPLIQDDKTFIVGVPTKEESLRTQSSTHVFYPLIFKHQMHVHDGWKCGKHSRWFLPTEEDIRGVFTFPDRIQMILSPLGIFLLGSSTSPTYAPGNYSSSVEMFTDALTSIIASKDGELIFNLLNKLLELKRSQKVPDQISKHILSVDDNVTPEANDLVRKAVDYVTKCFEELSLTVFTRENGVALTFVPWKKTFTQSDQFTTAYLAIDPTLFTKGLDDTTTLPRADSVKEAYKQQQEDPTSQTFSWFNFCEVDRRIMDHYTAKRQTYKSGDWTLSNLGMNQGKADQMMKTPLPILKNPRIGLGLSGWDIKRQLYRVGKFQHLHTFLPDTLVDIVKVMIGSEESRPYPVRSFKIPEVDESEYLPFPSSFDRFKKEWDESSMKDGSTNELFRSYLSGLYGKGIDISKFELPGSGVFSNIWMKTHILEESSYTLPIVLSLFMWITIPQTCIWFFIAKDKSTGGDKGNLVSRFIVVPIAGSGNRPIEKFILTIRPSKESSHLIETSKRSDPKVHFRQLSHIETILYKYGLSPAPARFIDKFLCIKSTEESFYVDVMEQGPFPIYSPMISRLEGAGFLDTGIPLTGESELMINESLGFTGYYDESKRPPTVESLKNDLWNKILTLSKHENIVTSGVGIYVIGGLSREDPNIFFSVLDGPAPKLDHQLLVTSNLGLPCYTYSIKSITPVLSTLYVLSYFAIILSKFLSSVVRKHIPLKSGSKGVEGDVDKFGIRDVILAVFETVWKRIASYNAAVSYLIKETLKEGYRLSDSFSLGLPEKVGKVDLDSFKEWRYSETEKTTHESHGDTFVESMRQVLTFYHVVTFFMLRETPQSYPEILLMKLKSTYSLYLSLLEHIDIEKKDTFGQYERRVKSVYGDINRFIQLENLHHESFDLDQLLEKQKEEEEGEGSETEEVKGHEKGKHGDIYNIGTIHEPGVKYNIPVGCFRDLRMSEKNVGHMLLMVGDEKSYTVSDVKAIDPVSGEEKTNYYPSVMIKLFLTSTSDFVSENTKNVVMSTAGISPKLIFMNECKTAMVKKSISQEESEEHVGIAIYDNSEGFESLHLRISDIPKDIKGVIEAVKNELTTSFVPSIVRYFTNDPENNRSFFVIGFENPNDQPTDNPKLKTDLSIKHMVIRHNQYMGDDGNIKLLHLGSLFSDPNNTYVDKLRSYMSDPSNVETITKFLVNKLITEVDSLTGGLEEVSVVPRSSLKYFDTPPGEVVDRTPVRVETGPRSGHDAKASMVSDTRIRTERISPQTQGLKGNQFTWQWNVDTKNYSFTKDSRDKGESSVKSFGKGFPMLFKKE